MANGDYICRRTKKKKKKKIGRAHLGQYEDIQTSFEKKKKKKKKKKKLASSLGGDAITKL